MDRLLTQEEACQRLGGIGRTTIWKLGKPGKDGSPPALRGVNIGKRRLYPESEIERLIERLRADS